MAAAFLATTRTATVLWLENAGKVPLVDLVDRLLGRLTFDDPGVH